MEVYFRFRISFAHQLKDRSHLKSFIKWLTNYFFSKQRKRKSKVSYMLGSLIFLIHSTLTLSIKVDLKTIRSLKSNSCLLYTSIYFRKKIKTIDLISPKTISYVNRSIVIQLHVAYSPSPARMKSRRCIEKNLGAVKILLKLHTTISAPYLFRQHSTNYTQHYWMEL